MALCSCITTKDFENDCNYINKHGSINIRCNRLVVVLSKGFYTNK